MGDLDFLYPCVWTNYKWVAWELKQQLRGHKSIRTTEVIAHLGDKHLYHVVSVSVQQQTSSYASIFDLEIPARIIFLVPSQWGEWWWPARKCRHTGATSVRFYRPIQPDESRVYSEFSIRVTNM